MIEGSAPLPSLQFPHIDSFFKGFRALLPDKRIDLDTVTQFFERFRETYRPPTRDLTDALPAMQRFIASFRHDRPPQPLNVLRLFNLSRNELAHSAIIAWLLGPHEEHAVGHLYLAGLLELCHVRIDPDSVRDYVVKREFPYAESIIDVLAYRRGQRSAKNAPAPQGREKRSTP